jgi:hypothetical protein
MVEQVRFHLRCLSLLRYVYRHVFGDDLRPQDTTQADDINNSACLATQLLRSAVTLPIKNFFSSSLAPTRSSSYPSPCDTHSSGTTLNCTDSLSRLSTGTSLNCTATYPPPPASTCTSLNCNFAQTPHDMPSGLAGALGHLGTHPDDMPSGHPDLTDILGYRPEDMPSGPPDYHSKHVGHLGHLGYLGLLGHLGYLNTLDPEPIEDIPLHAFIEEEGST